MDIISAASRYRMFECGDRVLVAVSGGPDSVAMLHALHAHADEFGITLHVAHLNHGIRGVESKVDQDFVVELAQQFGITAITATVDVPALKVELRVGEEEAARVARYKFLQETATDLNATKIAVGHTADDRAESVLINVIRGAGVEGLGSIRPVRGNIVRPLIDTTRAEVLAYVAENALPYRVDESNMDLTYTRNRVRHELLPLLETNYNPRIREALVKLADIAAAESDFVDQQAGFALARVRLRGAIDVGLFAELPNALRRRILRLEIQRLKGDVTDLSLEQVDRVLDALTDGGDFTIALPSGKIYAARSGDEFQVIREELIEPVEPFEYELAVPGDTPILEAGVIIRAELIENAAARVLDPNEVLLNAGAVSGTLRARSARPGDRIRPFGMVGSKKLQDVFVDRKVPRRDRARAVVVADAEKTLWVAGVIASEATRISGTAARAIYLRAETVR